MMPAFCGLWRGQPSARPSPPPPRTPSYPNPRAITAIGIGIGAVSIRAIIAVGIRGIVAVGAVVRVGSIVGVRLVIGVPSTTALDLFDVRILAGHAELRRCGQGHGL